MSRKLRSCKFRWLFNINEGLELLKLADTVLILINPSPSNVKIIIATAIKVGKIKFPTVILVIKPEAFKKTMR